MEKMHFVTARKSASDRSAPVASLVVADSYTFKPMPPLDGGQGKEPEGTSVPSVCFLGKLIQNPDTLRSKVR